MGSRYDCALLRHGGRLFWLTYQGEEVFKVYDSLEARSMVLMLIMIVSISVSKVGVAAYIC